MGGKIGAKKIPGSETDFKRKFRNSIRGWSEVYEPSRGSGTGYPDVQVLHDGLLIPVEAKVAKLDQGLIWSRDIRPVQIGWHFGLMKAGGFSAFVFGVLERKRWDAYVFPVCSNEFYRLMAWRDGISTSVMLKWDWESPDNIGILCGLIGTKNK